MHVQLSVPQSQAGSMTLWIVRCQDEEKCNEESLWRSLVEGHGHGYGRIIERSVGDVHDETSGLYFTGHFECRVVGSG